MTKFVKKKVLQDKIKIAAVSYLNAKPLLFAFEGGALKNEIELTIDYPSKIAEQLIKKEVDIALVPVAVIPKLKEYYIISDYCIATEGEVASVCLFSEVPIDQIETILLDYQSQTSVALLKILLREHWKITPVLQSSEIGYEASIKDNVAGLVIGDRALMQRNKSNYIYDLGLAWKEMTGMPFVFAVWVSNKKITDDFIKNFNQATGEGLNNLDTILSGIVFPHYDMQYYYTKNINFLLDSKKQESLKMFLAMIK